MKSKEIRYSFLDVFLDHYALNSVLWYYINQTLTNKISHFVCMSKFENLKRWLNKKNTRSLKKKYSRIYSSAQDTELVKCACVRTHTLIFHQYWEKERENVISIHDYLLLFHQSKMRIRNAFCQTSTKKHSPNSRMNQILNSQSNVFKYKLDFISRKIEERRRGANF